MIIPRDKNMFGITRSRLTDLLKAKGRKSVAKTKKRFDKAVLRKTGTSSLMQFRKRI